MMYPMYVHLGDNHTAHGVTMPDFPGCYTAADHYDDLPRMVQEAVELHFEDEAITIPKPTSIQELASRKEYQDGGIWMLFDINLSKIDTRVKRINVTLPENLVAKIDEHAQAEKLSRSAFIAKAAEKAIAS